MVAILLLLSSCFEKGGSSSSKVVKKANDKVADILPENTTGLFKASSIASLYAAFLVKDNSIMGNPIPEIGEVTKKIGFNPLNLNDLAKNGFDTSKPVGSFVAKINVKEGNNDRPDINFGLFVPVSNSVTALTTVKNIFKVLSNDKVKFSEDGKFTVIDDDTPNSPKAYVFEKEGYLFFVMNVAGNTKAFAEEVLSSKTMLKNSVNYKNITKKVSAAENIFMYIDINKIASKNIETITKLIASSNPMQLQTFANGLSYIKEYNGVASSVDFSQKDVVIKWAADTKEGAKSISIVKDVKFNKSALLGIKENPVVLLATALNITEYFKMIKENLDPEAKKEMDKGFADINAEFGIDVEKDIINTLDGNFGIGVYDGATINFMNYNAIIVVGVKDIAKLKESISKMYAKMPAQQKQMIMKTGDDYKIMAGMVQVFAGFSSDAFIIASSQKMFDAAKKGGNGFISNITDKELKNSLKGDINNFYIGFEELSKALKNFTGMIPVPQKVFENVNKFSYILFNSSVDGNTFVGDLSLRTNFEKPFIESVVELSKQKGQKQQ